MPIFTALRLSLSVTAFSFFNYFPFYFCLCFKMLCVINDHWSRDAIFKLIYHTEWNFFYSRIELCDNVLHANVLQYAACNCKWACQYQRGFSVQQAGYAFRFQTLSLPGPTFLTFLTSLNSFSKKSFLFFVWMIIDIWNCS